MLVPRAPTHFALAGSLLLGAFIAGCHGPDDSACTAAWEAPLDDADADDQDLGCAILSVAADGPGDAYFAGGSLGVEPAKGCALHFDGEQWTELDLDVPETYWWVAMTPSGAAWLVGEDGLAVRWGGGVGTRFETGVDATLFGVWAAADDDVWAVGGSDGGGDSDVLLHFDGAAWTQVAPPEVRGTYYFKVWGAAADDVWVVGAEGLILHYDGQAWSLHTEWTDEYGTAPRLFTVHGRAADDVWAVGESTTVLHFDGASWTEWEDPTGATVFGGGLTGVHVAPSGSVCVVGDGGVRFTIPTEGAHVETLPGATDPDLHATWCDDDGEEFAVGGNYLESQPAARDGAILHYGCPLSREGLP